MLQSASGMRMIAVAWTSAWRLVSLVTAMQLTLPGITRCRPSIVHTTVIHSKSSASSLVAKTHLVSATALDGRRLTIFCVMCQFICWFWLFSIACLLNLLLSWPIYLLLWECVDGDADEAVEARIRIAIERLCVCVCVRACVRACVFVCLCTVVGNKN